MPTVDVCAISAALEISIPQARRFLKRPFTLEPVGRAPSGKNGGGRRKLYNLYEIMSRAVTELGALPKHIQNLKEAAV